MAGQIWRSLFICFLLTIDCLVENEMEEFPSDIYLRYNFFVLSIDTICFGIHDTKSLSNYYKLWKEGFVLIKGYEMLFLILGYWGDGHCENNLNNPWNSALAMKICVGILFGGS